MKGSKSVYHILDSENIAGNNTNWLQSYSVDLVLVIKHIHDRCTIHTGIKLRHVIHVTDGDIIIDLDITVKK